VCVCVCVLVGVCYTPFGLSHHCEGICREKICGTIERATMHAQEGENDSAGCVNGREEASQREKERARAIERGRKRKMKGERWGSENESVCEFELRELYP